MNLRCNPFSLIFLHYINFITKSLFSWPLPRCLSESPGQDWTVPDPCRSKNTGHLFIDLQAKNKFENVIQTLTECAHVQDSTGNHDHQIGYSMFDRLKRPAKIEFDAHCHQTAFSNRPNSWETDIASRHRNSHLAGKNHKQRLTIDSYLTDRRGFTSEI